jgi:lipid II:glycine glycyltransferase (peptidoglycan interpeptide bridge formation enzyme)
MPELTKAEWSDFLEKRPEAHLLQTPGWGELKSSFGWDSCWIADHPIESASAGAQILFRRLPLGFHIAYIPKGPVADWQIFNSSSEFDRFWATVDESCRRRKTIFLKVEPDAWQGQDRSNALIGAPPPGFSASRQSIQPPRTIVVDLSTGEHGVLERMRQKTRYNVRLAMKKGVDVQRTDDIDSFYRLTAVTGKRDGFSVHSIDYFRRVHQIFHALGECEIFIAKYRAQPLAAVIVFAHGSRSWYFYGASSNENRELMASYLVQWEAMRWAIERGCLEYDLWGVPDVSPETLEREFAHREDGLWGVYRFKRGFGGVLRRSVGPWDRVYMPGLYRIYVWLLARNKISQG